MDFSGLSLTDMIRLREQVSEEITRRFEKKLCVAFSDVASSTQYFAKFGDNAGRALQQRHIDLLNECLPAFGGRVVDTAGDGAFLVYPTVEQATDSLTLFQQKLALVNALRPTEHHLQVRVGVHWGSVLTDDTIVTGDSVNLCARVSSSAAVGTIRITKQAFMELDGAKRVRCRPLPALDLRGITQPVEVFELGWREPVQFPTLVIVEETGARHKIPRDKDTVTFGRLPPHDGMPGNDIVLTMPDDASIGRISRWHFEVRRMNDGFHLRRTSDQTTEVDGVPVDKNDQVLVKVGTRVRLGGVMTLVFAVDITPQEIVSTIMR